jgi:hypothetical protein
VILALAEPHHRTSEKVRELMDDKVLTFSQLTAEDRAIYMELVNAPRWREQAEEYKERAENAGRSALNYELLRLYTIIRGCYFHYDQKRAERIQNFMKDMQVKYDCDSIDRRVFPGYDERWQ